MSRYSKTRLRMGAGKKDAEAPGHSAPPERKIMTTEQEEQLLFGELGAPPAPQKHRPK